MDIDARIRRRIRRDEKPRLIQDYEPLSPVAHVDEPSGRGPVFEQLLDHLGPSFDGELPPNGYLYGPFGSGKSAIASSLFRHLSRFGTETRSMIHTSTRGRAPTLPYFVSVDLREVSGRFAFYHQVLDSLAEEAVPEHGISTEELRARLRSCIGSSRAGGVVLVDHIGEPNTFEVDVVVELFAGLPNSMSWLAVGRRPPEEMPLTEYTATVIGIEPYQTQMLVDIVMKRASQGLTDQKISYEHARQIADWADGNAHNALAALFMTADTATRQERTQVTQDDVRTAIEAIPDSSVSLDRVLGLPTNKQAVLRKLVDLAPGERTSVKQTTDAISTASTIDLSRGTVKRFLYELAECGILKRVETVEKDSKGRPPSRVEIQFPATAFRRLYDLQHKNGED